MKNNQLSIIAASLILGVSFIIGCLVISSERADSSRQSSQAVNSVNAEKSAGLMEQPVLTLAETAEILNLEVDQVMNIIKAEHAILSNNGVFTGTMLPYIKVDDKFLVNRADLLLWLKDATLEKRVYSGVKVTR